jgi:FecR-like protein
MTRIWHPIHKALAGVFVAALCAFSQSTISARPGTINYVEGHASINGQPIDQGQIGHLNLDANQTIRTDQNSKAEILLTPGVFLRLGSDAELQMIAPSLTNTKVEILRGEALVAVAPLYKDNNLEVMNNGASTQILKKGIYSFNADPPQVSVYDGKAAVVDGDRHVDVKKGRRVTFTSGKLKAEKFDRKQHDDLYAWSNLRSRYAAEASYATARNIVVNNYAGWGYNAGWFWNPWYSSWAFLPGAGYFSGPFGWSFYSPAAVYYAPRYFIRPGYSYPVNRSFGRVPPGVHQIIRGPQSTPVRPAPSIQAPRPAPRVAVPRASMMRSPGVRR